MSGSDERGVASELCDPPPASRASIRIAAIATLSALALAFCATPARARERVLALAPHVVEMLFAIGAGDRIVGAVRFSDYPPEARGLPQVGGYKAIAVEAALRLRPTLAITLDDSASGIERLRDLGVRVEVSRPQSIDGVLADIVRIGAMVDCEPAARALSRRLGARLEELRARRPARPPRVFYEVWHQPLLTAGGSSFLSSALAEIGVENVFDGVATETVRVSPEAVLRAAPDAIVIPTEARDVAERERVWRTWFGDRPELVVIAAEHDLLHRPGPRLIEGMERLQAALLRSMAGAGGIER
jgi:ABC-type hemin transport system substrate-binding protein